MGEEKYIDKYKRDTTKDIIKIRLQVLDLNINYRKEENQPLYQLDEKQDNTTEHVLQCRRDEYRKQKNIKGNIEEELEEVVQTFRENKRKIVERIKKVQEEKHFL